MNEFERMFKVTTLLVVNCDDSVQECFMPKLEQCSHAYDNGDRETAEQMLTFISDKLIAILEA